jgi:hypothetical protein
MKDNLRSSHGDPLPGHKPANAPANRIEKEAFSRGIGRQSWQLDGNPGSVA